MVSKRKAKRRSNDNKDRECYHIKNVNNSIEDNFNYYVKDFSISPYAIFRKLDLADRYIFDGNISFDELGNEYGLNRERVRQLVLKSQDEILRLDIVKDYMKDLGGNNERRTIKC